MIVKFENGNGWQYVGEVQDVSTYFPPSRNVGGSGNESSAHTDRSETSGETLGDEFQMTYYAVLPEPTDAVGSTRTWPRLVRITAYRSNGQMVSITTNRFAYLCNEQGQTIEKLN